MRVSLASISFPTLLSRSTLPGDRSLGSFYQAMMRIKLRYKRFSPNIKYESQYGRMLSFFSGEVSKAQKKKGVNGIRQVLSLVEAAPREVVGVQHLLLEMRLLNEWLCVAEKKREAGTR